MAGTFVVLTGASGSGKTALALEVEKLHPEFTIFRFDTIGVPEPDVMAAYGTGHQPGGAWQRGMTLEWLGRMSPTSQPGKCVLFEGQMRISFIKGALAYHNIQNARVVLV